MKLYGIVEIVWENELSDELRGFGMCSNLFNSYNEAENYLYEKGYKFIGQNQYEIGNNEFDYVAEIFELEASL